MWSIVALVSLTLCWALREILRWRAARAARATVVGAMGQLSTAQAASGGLQDEVLTLRGMVEQERKRADAYLGKIDEVIGERDDRFRRSQQDSAGHAVAQDMMIREIESLAGQYDRLCKAVLKAQSLDEAHKLVRRAARRNRALGAVIEEILGPERAAALQALARSTPATTQEQ